MTKPSVAIITLGCKVNQYDSDAMLAILKTAGFEIFDELVKADVYVLNTCAVTAEAERKSRQYVTKILKVNPNAEIYVCGCASQNNFLQFEKEHVAFIAGTEGKIRLAKELAVRYGGVEDGYFADLVPASFDINKQFEENEGVVSLRTRHYIKVQDGCNNFCSYCLVPYVRGRSRTRKLDGILSEFDEAVKVSKEVVVTGINLSAYGKDNGSSLVELLYALADYDCRIRLGSLEVNVIDEKLLDATKALKSFCPHFHLSLQSGDDETLKAMNRHYNTGEFEKAVELIRKYYPNAGVTTDVIVGFPTETEEQFENSMAFCRRVKFSDMHVFPYSSRKGTVAGRLPVLTSAVLDDRAKRMGEVKRELSSNYLDNQIGVPVEVLFETEEDGYWCGHTPNYIKVYSRSGERNTLKIITPTERFKDGLKG